MTHSLISLEECLCRPKLQEHVETHGDVVGIVGDIKADNLLVVSVLALDKREDETTELLLGALNLKFILTDIFDP